MTKNPLAEYMYDENTPNPLAEYMRTPADANLNTNPVSRYGGALMDMFKQGVSNRVNTIKNIPNTMREAASVSKLGLQKALEFPSAKGMFQGVTNVSPFAKNIQAAKAGQPYNKGAARSEAMGHLIPSVAAGALGGVGDIFNTGFIRPLHMGRDLLFRDKDMPVMDKARRVLTNDRPTGELLIDAAGKGGGADFIDNLVQRGMSPEAARNILQNVLYAGGYGADAAEMLLLPEAIAGGVGKLAAGSARAGKLADIRAKRAARPFRDKMSTQGESQVLSKFMSQPDGGELQAAAKAMNTPEPPPVKPTPMKRDIDGQGVFDFATRKQGQQTLDLSVPESVPKLKGQQSFRFARRGVKDGIKSPSIKDIVQPPKTQKTSIKQQFKTGHEPELLDYLNKSFTDYEIVKKMPAKERVRLGNMSSSELRDTIASMKNVKIKPQKVDAKTVFGKKIQKQMIEKEQVPLHPASAGKKNIFKNNKGQTDLFSKDSGEYKPSDIIKGVKKVAPFVAKKKKRKLSKSDMFKEAKSLEEAGHKMAASTMRQDAHNIGKPRPPWSNNKGQADFGDLTPEQRSAVEKAGIASIFKKKASAKPTKIYPRRSKLIGKEVTDSSTGETGKITAHNAKTGVYTFKGAGKEKAMTRDDFVLNYKGSSIFKKAAKPLPSDTTHIDRIKRAQSSILDDLKGMGPKETLTGTDRIKYRALTKRYSELGKELKELLPQSKAKPTFLEKLADEGGFARIGRDDDTKSRIMSIVNRAKAAGLSVEEYLKKTTSLKAHQINILKKEIDSWKGVRTPITEDTSIGNVHVGKLISKGTVSPKEGELLIKASRAHPRAFEKGKTVTREMRGRAANLKAEGLSDHILSLTDEEAAAAANVKVAKAGAIIKKHLKNPRKAVQEMLDEVADLAAQHSKLSTFGGRFLEAGKDPVGAEELISSLQALYKSGTLSRAETARLEDILKTVDHLKASKLYQYYNYFHEFAINNMLSAAITHSRNIFGTAASGGQMFLDKAASILISKLLPKAAFGGTESYARELIPGIKALITSTPKHLKNGVRYFRFEDTLGVVKHLSKKIKKIRLNKELSIKQRHIRIKELLSDIKAVYKDSDATRLEEIMPTGKRVIGSDTNKIIDVIGYYINTSSRGLVAEDKVFTGTFREAQSAMKKIKKSIQTNTPLDKIKFTAAEEEAIEDVALYYVYRAKLPKTLGRWADFIVKTPVFNTLAAFFKTNTNIIRYAMDHSPIGALKVIRKNYLTNGLYIDADQAGKVIAGTATTSALWHVVKEAGGHFIGAAKSMLQRDLWSQQGLPEKRIEFRDKLGKVTHYIPFSNLAPFTIPLLFLSAIEEYMTNKKKGVPSEGISKNENLKEVTHAFIKGLMKESAYETMSSIAKAIDRDAPSKVAYGGGQGETGSLGKYAHRQVAGWTVSNMIRNVNRTGKFFGIKIKEPDKAIYKPRTFVEAIRADFGFTKGIPKKVDFTGKPAERVTSVTPFNPNFWGMKPKKNDIVFNTLEDLTVYPSRIKKTVSGDDEVSVYLTEKERSQMARDMGPDLYKELKRTIKSGSFKFMKDTRRRDRLKKIISKYYRRGYKKTRKDAIKRMRSTAEGRKSLKWNRTKGLSETPSIFKGR